MQTKVELASCAARLEFPSVVDSGGDALLAAMSDAVHQQSSGGNLADVVSSLQQQVLALQSDQGSAGDIDALGKGGGKGKKGGGKGGNGVGDGSGKGAAGGINASCWWCGVFGHRQK